MDRQLLNQFDKSPLGEFPSRGHILKINTINQIAGLRLNFSAVSCNGSVDFCGRESSVQEMTQRGGVLQLLVLLHRCSRLILDQELAPVGNSQ